MTRRISSGLAIAGLIAASPAIIEIASHFINKSKPLIFIRYLPDEYAIVVMLCGVCVIQYIFGFVMNVFYINVNENPILEKKFRVIFENPLSKFLIWRETLDVFKERRGW